MLDAVAPPVEVLFSEIKDDVKTVVFVKKDEFDRKLKVTQKFKIEKVRVSPSIVKRRNWAKFGNASKDGKGLNSNTTRLNEPVQMEFVKLKTNADASDALDTNEVKSILPRFEICRLCEGSHLSSLCPNKEIFTSSEKGENKGVSAATTTSTTTPTPSGLFAPVLAQNAAFKNQDNTIRITNLTDAITEEDIKDLCSQFGRILRIAISKDRVTRVSKGVCYVSFLERSSAETALKTLNNYGYDRLILTVDWAKSSRIN